MSELQKIISELSFERSEGDIVAEGNLFSTPMARKQILSDIRTVEKYIPNAFNRLQVCINTVNTLIKMPFDGGKRDDTHYWDMKVDDVSRFKSVYSDILNAYSDESDDEIKSVTKSINRILKVYYKNKKDMKNDDVITAYSRMAKKAKTVWLPKVLSFEKEIEKQVDDVIKFSLAYEGKMVGPNTNTCLDLLIDRAKANVENCKNLYTYIYYIINPIEK